VQDLTKHLKDLTTGGATTTKRTPAHDAETKSPEDEAFQLLTELRNVLVSLRERSDLLPKETAILRRLYFDSIHRREDAVGTAEEGTFEWLFETTDQLPEIKEELSVSSCDDKTDDEDNSAYGSEDASFEEADPSEPPMAVHDTHNEVQAEPQQRLSPVREGSNETGSQVSFSHRSDKPPPRQVKIHQDASRLFHSFVQDGSGVFFIYGKAGSGKSTLMKLMGNHQAVEEGLRQWSGGRRLVLMKSYFWNSGHKLQMSLEGFYRTVLFEVLSQCPELIPQTFADEWEATPLVAEITESYRLPEL
jgi:hypothetical protein